MQAIRATDGLDGHKLMSMAGLTSAAELEAANADLDVAGPLHPLLPEGVAPGSTVVVGGSVALALALVASLAGVERWVAGVGCGPVGLVAGRELGLGWDRLVLVEPPDRESWPTAVAATLDAFDIVMMRPLGRARERDIRRLMTRARERATVLVGVETAGHCGAGWPGADVRLRVTGRHWEGLGEGHGYLRRRRVVVEASGRGRLAQGRRLELWLPGTGGAVESITSPVATTSPVSSDGTGMEERAVS